jgi:hypothetical protein
MTATAETFDPAMTRGPPEPARRWLSHAIAPGTPLWDRPELTMHGQIKLGRWRPFTARQVLTPPGGYVWAAKTRLAGLPVTGYDRLASGAGEIALIPTAPDRVPARSLESGHGPAARGRVLPGRDHRCGFQLRRYR